MQNLFPTGFEEGVLRIDDKFITGGGTDTDEGEEFEELEDDDEYEYDEDQKN